MAAYTCPTSKEQKLTRILTQRFLEVVRRKKFLDYSHFRRGFPWESLPKSLTQKSGIRGSSQDENVPEACSGLSRKSVRPSIHTHGSMGTVILAEKGEVPLFGMCSTQFASMMPIQWSVTISSAHERNPRHFQLRLSSESYFAGTLFLPVFVSWGVFFKNKLNLVFDQEIPYARVDCGWSLPVSRTGLIVFSAQERLPIWLFWS